MTYDRTPGTPLPWEDEYHATRDRGDTRAQHAVTKANRARTTEALRSRFGTRPLPSPPPAKPWRDWVSTLTSAVRS